MIKNIQIARQTIEITAKGGYDYNGGSVSLDPFGKYDFTKVEVLSPDALAAIADESKNSATAPQKSNGCKFRIVNADSFAAARQLPNALVMNFANAHVPGGGFLNGAVAQEEALCRNSTLYASISSKAAREMYNFNITHPSACYSDYMLFSPDVCVFRDESCALLPAPFMCAVMTCPAPNRNGSACLVSREKLDRVMTDRLEKYLAAAAQKGCRSLVLGAWGCGAFGHDAKNVAQYFYTLFFGEYGKKDFFDNVVFAVMERNPNEPKISAFRDAFGENAEYCDDVSQIVAD